MYLKRYLGLIVISVLTGTSAFSADVEGKFSVRGIGGQPCSMLISIFDSPDVDVRREGVTAFQSWIAGYLSAYNRLQAETYDAVPFLDMINVLAITVNECKTVPSVLVESTVNRIVGAFNQARVVSESLVVSVQDAVGQKSYHQDTIILAQQRLIDLGYLSSVADGLVGPATTEALRLYQSDSGISVTGELDVDSMFNLLLQ